MHTQSRCGMADDEWGVSKRKRIKNVATSNDAKLSISHHIYKKKTSIEIHTTKTKTSIIMDIFDVFFFLHLFILFLDEAEISEMCYRRSPIHFAKEKKNLMWKCLVGSFIVKSCKSILTSLWIRDGNNGAYFTLCHKNGFFFLLVQATDTRISPEVLKFSHKSSIEPP